MRASRRNIGTVPGTFPVYRAGMRGSAQRTVVVHRVGRFICDADFMGWGIDRLFLVRLWNVQAKTWAGIGFGRLIHTRIGLALLFALHGNGRIKMLSHE